MKNSLFCVIVLVGVSQVGCTSFGDERQSGLKIYCASEGNADDIAHARCSTPSATVIMSMKNGYEAIEVIDKETGVRTEYEKIQGGAGGIVVNYGEMEFLVGIGGGGAPTAIYKYGDKSDWSDHDMDGLWDSVLLYQREEAYFRFGNEFYLYDKNRGGVMVDGKCYLLNRGSGDDPYVLGERCK